jgi:hypothetical protein
MNATNRDATIDATARWKMQHGLERTMGYSLVVPIGVFHENQGEYLALNNLPLGRSSGEAARSIAEINGRRAALGLCLVRIINL